MTAAVPLLLPTTMTPAMAEVLGLMCFRTGPLCEVYRAAGHNIRRRVEDEQAFILHRFLLLALEHGEGWRAKADADIHAMLASARTRAQERKRPDDSGDRHHEDEAS